jgi:hypothetical protein
MRYLSKRDNHHAYARESVFTAKIQLATGRFDLPASSTRDVESLRTYRDWNN